MEGIADELFERYALFPEKVTRRKSRLVGSGNGIRRNKALRKILADRFGLSLSVPPVHREEAAYGSALTAGVGLGLYRGRLSADSHRRLFLPDFWR